MSVEIWMLRWIAWTLGWCMILTAVDHYSTVVNRGFGFSMLAFGGILMGSALVRHD